MVAVSCMNLELFLTWLDCSINVISQDFAWMHHGHTLHMYQFKIADDLGACYMFLYQHVRANCSGFSQVFILTFIGLM